MAVVGAVMEKVGNLMIHLLGNEPPQFRDVTGMNNGINLTANLFGHETSR